MAGPGGGDDGCDGPSSHSCLPGGGGSAAGGRTAAADDLLHDLGGAAEDRRDAAEPSELTIVPENSGVVLPPVKSGLPLVSASHGVRAVRSGWRSSARGSSGRVAAPRAAAWRRRRRRTSGRGYPSRRCGRRFRSSSRQSCHRSSRCAMPATAARCGRAPASRRAAIRTSAGVSTLTTTAWARAAPDGHRDSETVVRRRAVTPVNARVWLGQLLAVSPASGPARTADGVGRSGVRSRLWVPTISSTSRDQAIFVDRATGASLSSHAVLPENDRLW